MANTIKPLGAEISISTANNVGLAKCVRVYNPGSAAVLTFSYANGAVYANATLGTESMVVEKQPTDKLAGTGMLAVPVAFSN